MMESWDGSILDPSVIPWKQLPWSHIRLLLSEFSCVKLLRGWRVLFHLLKHNLYYLLQVFCTKSFLHLQWFSLLPLCTHFHTWLTPIFLSGLAWLSLSFESLNPGLGFLLRTSLAPCEIPLSILCCILEWPFICLLFPTRSTKLEFMSVLFIALSSAPDKGPACRVLANICPTNKLCIHKI